MQAEHVIDLKARVDGQTFLANTTDYSASMVSTGAIKELTEILAMMNQLAASVTSQAATVIILPTKINGGGGSSGWNTDKKNVRPGLHMCRHCKRGVYHKYVNCLELESNKVKRCPV